ncbi:MAG: alpha/beta fold hydrolase [Halobacteriota archaeon]
MAGETDVHARFERAQARLIDHHDLDASSRFETVDEPVERIHYLHAGSGTPVVFLPGVASPAALFVPLMAGFEGEFELFAPDRPGRGLSDPYTHRKGDIRAFTRTFLDAFLDAIGVDEVAFVASSFGGFQAFAYALDRPARVDRISFVGSPAGLSRSLPIPYRLLGVKLINRLMFRLIRADTIDDVRRSMAQINVEDPDALSEPMLETILYAGQLPDRSRSLRTLFETTAGIRGMSKHMLVRDEVDELTQPLQFVWGSEDYFYPPELGREATASLEAVEFHELEGHGHTPWLEPENAVGDFVSDFLSD